MLLDSKATDIIHRDLKELPHACLDLINSDRQIENATNGNLIILEGVKLLDIWFKKNESIVTLDSQGVEKMMITLRNLLSPSIPVELNEPR